MNPPPDISEQVSVPILDAHVALFYESEGNRDEVVRAFILNGLSRDEKVLYLVDPKMEDQILTVLDLNWGEPLEAYRVGKLQIGGPSQGQSITPDLVINHIHAELERAKVEGRRGLSVALDMTWMLKGHASSHSYIDYEAKVEVLMRSQSLTHLCLFDQSHLNPQLLLDALMCHPQVMLGGELYENPLHVYPSDLVEENRERVFFQSTTGRLRQRKLDEAELRNYQVSLENLVRDHTVDLEATQEMLLHKSGEHIRLLEELSESEERYRSFFFGSHLVMLLYDSETGEIVDATLTANRYYGYTRSQLIGMNIADINQLLADQLHQVINDSWER